MGGGHFEMLQPDDEDDLDVFLATPGRRRWHDGVRRALVARIMAERGYDDPVQVTRRDFGSHTAAFRVKRFGQRHDTMIAALFPVDEEAVAAPSTEPTTVVVPSASVVVEDDRDLEDARREWVGVVVTNAVLYAVLWLCLWELMGMLVHLQRWLAVYLALGNVAVRRCGGVERARWSAMMLIRRLRDVVVRQGD